MIADRTLETVMMTFFHFAGKLEEYTAEITNSVEQKKSSREENMRTQFTLYCHRLAQSEVG